MRRLVVALGMAITGVVASCSDDALEPGVSESDASTVVDSGGDAPPTAFAPDGQAVDPPPPLPRTYTNPVFAADFPDPFVLRDGERYLAFATNAGNRNVRTLVSTDLSTWSELPDALPILPAWALANASLTWAPSVLRRGDRFVLYFTARSIASGFQCIGRATATNAAGPYVDDSSAPFVCQVAEPSAFCGSIDPSPFVDENGDAYLLWKSDENATDCHSDARLWTQRLGVDGLSLLGVPTPLLHRNRSWEAPLIEGPSMLKHRASYYLFYSANWWEGSSYGIGYAVCATPLGPCTKKTLDGPLVGSRADTLGPGGQELFTDAKGKTWVAYHAWSAPTVGYANGGARSLRIDPLSFVDDVPTLGLSTEPRPL